MEVHCLNDFITRIWCFKYIILCKVDWIDKKKKNLPLQDCRRLHVEMNVELYGSTGVAWVLARTRVDYPRGSRSQTAPRQVMAFGQSIPRRHLVTPQVAGKIFPPTETALFTNPLIIQNKLLLLGTPLVVDLLQVQRGYRIEWYLINSH